MQVGDKVIFYYLVHVGERMQSREARVARIHQNTDIADLEVDWSDEEAQAMGFSKTQLSKSRAKGNPESGQWTELA